MMMSSVKFTTIGFLFVFVSSMANGHDYTTTNNSINSITRQADKGDIYENVLEEDLASEEEDEYDYNAADNYIDSTTRQAEKGDIYEDVLEEDLALEEEEVEPRSSRAPATCIPIQPLMRRVVEHPLSDCCANDMCEEGWLCRSFTYALKCYPATQLPEIFPALCNDEPVEGFCKPGLVEQTRQPQTCLQTSELGEALDVIINNPNTDCISNNDCELDGYENSKCRFFSSTFLACDFAGHFDGVYRPLCDFPTK